MEKPVTPKTRSDDPENFDPSSLREAGDFPRGHMTVRWGTKMVSIPSHYAAGLLLGFAFLMAMGTFSRWGIESPFISKRSNESNEHIVLRNALEDLQEQQSVANYILSQCLQPGPGRDCPKLPKPRRIIELEEEMRKGEHR